MIFKMKQDTKAVFLHDFFDSVPFGISVSQADSFLCLEFIPVAKPSQLPLPQHI